MQYGHVMATNALDDNQQAAGEKLEGTSRILEGFFHLFLTIIGIPWLGPWATSIIVGGLIMIIRLYNMRKRRKQLRENEELREYMLRDYSEFLGKQTKHALTNGSGFWLKSPKVNSPSSIKKC